MIDLWLVAGFVVCLSLAFGGLWFCVGSSLALARTGSGASGEGLGSGSFVFGVVRDLDFSQGAVLGVCLFVLVSRFGHQ